MILSIVIPSYNHNTYLSKRFESIFHQTFQDFEIIILDDASTDHSADLLKEYAQHPKVSHFIINTQNSGSPFKQWKKGIDLARGKYIWIAESDDWNAPDFLENAIRALESDQSIAMAVSNIIVVNEEGAPIKQWTQFQNETIPGNSLIKEQFVFGNYLPNTSAIVFRKDIAVKSSEWSLMFNMRFCGDWLFWSSLAKNSNIAFIAKPTTYWRKHTSSITNKAIDKAYHISEGLIIAKQLIKHINSYSYINYDDFFKSWEKTISDSQLSIKKNNQSYKLLYRYFTIRYFWHRLVSICQSKNFHQLKKNIIKEYRILTSDDYNNLTVKTVADNER